MIKRFILLFAGSLLGIFLADYFLGTFEVKGGWTAFLVASLLITAADFFIKPLLKIISLPLRIITLNLFGFVIDIFLVWLIIDVIMASRMEIYGFIPLLEATAIIWASKFVFSKFSD